MTNKEDFWPYDYDYFTKCMSLYNNESLCGLTMEYGADLVALVTKVEKKLKK